MYTLPIAQNSHPSRFSLIDHAQSSTRSTATRQDGCTNVPAYVAWRAGTTTLFLLDSWPPIDYLKIPAQESQSSPIKLRKKCEQ
jgi:hypothetical protein